tara:strand:+ start:5734 stop:5931 length:198 start_codon:yes stop_codon:yes gene_type:complete
MGTKRVKTVELQIGDKKESFEINHAERILKMPNNGGWKLPTDSKYIFDTNGLTVKSNKKTGTKSE